MKTTRILAIGNSFSEDSLEHLWRMAQDAGKGHLVIGHLMIGGCSLLEHATNIHENRPSYFYLKTSDGTWKTTGAVTLCSGLKDESWDIVTIQQASAYSGIPESYQPSLDTLVRTIRSTVSNPHVRIAFHMTWAYQKDSDHGGFVSYQNDQDVMTSRIIQATKTIVLPHPDIDMVIPSGQAIRRARTVFGDVLTRDGFHLDLTIGRRIASMTWLASLLQGDPERIRPVSGVFEGSVRERAIRCVKDALNDPFSMDQPT
jgi:hypothetical protein